jgi:hypothetical protein
MVALMSTGGMMNGLFGSTVLDTAVGLVLVYLLLSLICTTINEWIAGIFKTRAKFLEQGIARLLAGQQLPVPEGGQPTADLLKMFYAHPLVNSMVEVRDLSRPEKDTHPSYLDPRGFASVLMDLVTPKQPGTITFADLESGIKELPPGRVKTALLALVQNANGDLDRAQRNIEAWYNAAMDRVNGWYKRHMQWVTVLVAVSLALATNADTLKISSRLWSDPAYRELSVERVKALAALPGDQNKPIGQQDAVFLENVLGWQNQGPIAGMGIIGIFEKILGLLLTIIAISLGAPFWFDVLNKIVNLRSAGRSPEETAKPPDKPQAPPGNTLA